MTQFAYVENGSLVRFLATLPATFKGVQRVASLTPQARAALGLLPVMDVTPPYDPTTHRLMNAQPSVVIFPDHVKIARPIAPIPAQEIAQRIAREAVQNDSIAIDIRNRLKSATPAEINNYVDAQVTDLASARFMLKRILLVLALICRS